MIKNQIYRWAFFMVIFSCLLGLLYFYASVKNRSEIKETVRGITDEEALYAFNNLNDRLVFITNDLLDKFSEDHPDNQFEF